MSSSIEKYKDKENYIVPMTVEQKAGHLHAVILGEMAKDHIAGKRVLHAGCNAATTTFHIWPLEPEYLAGADVNVEAIQLAKETLPQAHFFHASATDLPFEDSSFDTVIAFAMFEHLFEEDKSLAAAEFRRVLKPGGCLLVQVPRAIPGSKDQKLKQNAYDPCHVSLYLTEDDLHADFPGWKCLKFYYEDRRNPNNNAQHCSWIAIYENQKEPDEEVPSEPEQEVPGEPRVTNADSDVDLRDLGHKSIRLENLTPTDESTDTPSMGISSDDMPSEAPEAREAPAPKSAQIRSPFGYGNPHDY